MLSIASEIEIFICSVYYGLGFYFRMAVAWLAGMACARRFVDRSNGQSIKAKDFTYDTLSDPERLVFRVLQRDLKLFVSL
jgi:hypothetical protein